MRGRVHTCCHDNNDICVCLPAGSLACLQYALDYYPPFASGCGFVLSKDLVQALLRQPLPDYRLLVSLPAASRSRWTGHGWTRSACSRTPQQKHAICITPRVRVHSPAKHVSVDVGGDVPLLYH
jgi:hypothetical protein